MVRDKDQSLLTAAAEQCRFEEVRSRDKKPKTVVDLQCKEAVAKEVLIAQVTEGEEHHDGSGRTGCQRPPQG